MPFCLHRAVAVRARSIHERYAADHGACGRNKHRGRANRDRRGRQGRQRSADPARPGAFQRCRAAARGRVACRCFRCYAGHTPGYSFCAGCFHVDASAASASQRTARAVTEWRDLRGAGYPFAVPPDTAPLWTANALNGLRSSTSVSCHSPPARFAACTGRAIHRQCEIGLLGVGQPVRWRLSARCDRHLSSAPGNNGTPLPLGYMFPRPHSFANTCPTTCGVARHRLTVRSAMDVRPAFLVHSI